ncbi:DeoR family transcriptional regulator [Vibrio sp. 10N.286.49.C2]|uniref:DeoR/GlpR family DNA-binding transcription regulator n=1 Tax=unclassified Vibrio TaxID=2614977 RepID=UPI000C84AF21|nr:MULTISPECIES: DeoR/GlpR family DNA-binding transcription regulator [unclassified Vibrio]PMH26428.1 DeoR family transcriptional regulator [Vibrio sp. 10N.286.49.C2]PMH54848.1 DeoR family transcriptional regulator [Vibrio sp. 10N.286.49.B1]
MTQDERLLEIQALLEQKRKITLNDLCQHFEISRDSARRDLVKLTQLPGIQRIRGGAISAPVTPHATAYLQKTMSQEKRDIGQAAANFVDPNDFILMDTGTTLSAMASYLRAPLTVVTNSVDGLSALTKDSDANIGVHVLGGEFNPFHRAILGTYAIQQLTKYRINKAFIGVCALSVHGVSTTSDLEASMKQAMIAQAEMTILVCDSSKFDQQHFFHVCGFEQVDVIICDKTPPAAIANIISANDIELILTTPSIKSQRA